METKVKRSSRSSMKGTSKNALRERTRVESLRRAYLELQAAIPSVPANTKLSKLDVLMLATTYISHLTQLLQEDDDSRNSHDDNNNDTSSNGEGRGVSGGERGGIGTRDSRSMTLHETSSRRQQQKGLLHPVKKWPMRARLYTDVGASEASHLLKVQGNMTASLPAHFSDKMDNSIPCVQTLQSNVNRPHSRMPTNSPKHQSTALHCQTLNHVPTNFSSCGLGFDSPVGDFSRWQQDVFGRPGVFHQREPLHRPAALRHHIQHGCFNHIEHQRRSAQENVSARVVPEYAGCWQSGIAWGPYMTYNDCNASPPQCHVMQPIGINGCLSAWDA